MPLTLSKVIFKVFEKEILTRISTFSKHSQTGLNLNQYMEFNLNNLVCCLSLNISCNKMPQPQANTSVQN